MGASSSRVELKEAGDANDANGAKDVAKDLRASTKAAQREQELTKREEKLQHLNYIDAEAEKKFATICAMIDKGKLQQAANEGKRELHLETVRSYNTEFIEICRRLKKKHKSYKGVKIKSFATYYEYHLVLSW